jgi:hypothetical protein
MFPSGSCDYIKYVSIILYSTTPLHQYKLKTNVIPATTFSCGTKKWDNHIDCFVMMRKKMDNGMEKPC